MSSHFEFSKFFWQCLDACLNVLQSPQTRTFWPALLSSWLIYFIYHRIRTRQWKLKQTYQLFIGHLFHPSSRMDLCLLFVRSIVNVSFILLFPWTATWVSVKLIYWIYIYIGAPGITIPMTYLTVAYSLSLLLLSDVSRYLLHRCMHRYEFLWRFHQVHHSAEVMTPLTLYRIHPVEQVIQKIRGILVVGICSGIFAWLSYGRASIWSLYGVPTIVILFTFFGANLRHSHCWLPYPAWLEAYLISPAQHQQHHDIASANQNCNYGSIFAIWDRWLGTLRSSHQSTSVTFGVDDDGYHVNPRTLSSLLLHPFTRYRNQVHRSSRED